VRLVYAAAAERLSVLGDTAVDFEFVDGVSIYRGVAVE